MRGRYIRIVGSSLDLQTPIRYKMWEFGGGVCAGKYVRQVCIISTGDLWRLKQSTALFVNKFNADYSPLAYSCVEQWMQQKVDDDRFGITTLDMKPYFEHELALHHA